MVRGVKQKFEILAIPKQYKDMLNDLVDSLDLEPLKILYPNDQKKCNPMLNSEDIPVDIEINLEKFSNISQQRKKTLKIGDNTILQLNHNNLLIRQEKYKKRRRIKGNKIQKGCQNGRVK